MVAFGGFREGCPGRERSSELGYALFAQFEEDGEDLSLNLGPLPDETSYDTRPTAIRVVGVDDYDEQLWETGEVLAFSPETASCYEDDSYVSEGKISVLSEEEIGRLNSLCQSCALSNGCPILLDVLARSNVSTDY